MRSSLKKVSFIFLVFVIGSFIGFAWENILTIIKGAYHLRQGLLYEPLIPIYGLGALIFYFVYAKTEFSDNKALCLLKVFLLAFIVGGITEYFCSFFQEKIFGTISWNYSYMKFDLNGRTSLLHCSFWGLMGLFFYLVVMPVLNKLKNCLDKRYFQVLTIVLSICFLCDVTISFVACYRRDERRNNIENNTRLAVFLDNHYTDEVIDRVYNNARTVAK